jgi:DNA-binding MarR family transcriptional regulator
MVKISSPFGGQARTRVLLALRLLDDSYPRELARLLGLPVNGVQMAVRGLERDGLVAGRPAGRTKLVRLNPQYFAREELQRYLLRLATADRDLTDRVAELRRRPRRTGKPL